jgi:C-terminal processing protease CtpA/Prc
MNSGDTEFSPATIRSVVEKSAGLLESRCIRLNGQGSNWRALFDEHLEDFVNATSPVEFESRMNAVVASGGLSHVAFFHQTGQRAPARYAINATFCTFDTPDGPRWLFQDVHERGPAHAAGLRPGDVLQAVNGRSIAPPELPTFALGTDARITIKSADEAQREVTVILPKADPRKRDAKPPMAEPTSVTARPLEPGIGYLRVAFFPGVNGQRFAREVDRALATLADCSRLIIDLRGNLGGFVGSLRLMSHLTPDRVPVGYSLTRNGENRKWKPDQLACIDRLPSSRLDTLKMAVRFLVLHRDRSIRLATEGLGTKPFHGRVVILVNEHTLSAGEMVAAFAQENGLARIVGRRTGGQVLGGGNFSVGQGFVLRFPAAAWYTWKGAVVEGRGVSPDVDVTLAPEELRRGNDTQLKAALDVVRSM